MNSRRRVVIVGSIVGAGLAMATAAQADRSGQAPVSNPHVVDSHHVSFTLLGAGWGQVRGQSGATPAVGRYGQRAGTGCRLTANVSATITSYRPTVIGDHVDVPGHFRPIRIAERGLDHGIRWWLGSQAGVRAAAVGYQRAPASLTRPGHPWLVYEIVLRGVSKEPSCTAAEGRRTGRAITRTMHIVAGAIHVTGPYYP